MMDRQTQSYGLVAVKDFLGYTEQPKVQVPFTSYYLEGDAQI